MPINLPSIPLPNKISAKQSFKNCQRRCRECIDKAEELASAAFDREAYAKRHAAWLSGKIDCTAFLTWFIENYPASAEQTKKADVKLWKRFR